MKRQPILGLLSLVGLIILIPIQASTLFVYQSPTGERVVSDRPLNLPGYQLEDSNVTPGAAGRSLRYQNNDANRQAIDRHIRTAAYLFQLEEALIKAVIRQESAFKIDARSRKGAMGLMQLMPATAKMYQVTDILDPKQNIHAGARHLSYLMKRFKRPELALAAYNAGEGAVRRYGGIPPYPETENYVKQVLRWYQQYQRNNS